MPPWLPMCAIGFVLGRLSLNVFPSCVHLPDPSSFDTATTTAQSSSPSSTNPQQHVDLTNNEQLKWKLDMRNARSYGGISVPLNNGYSAKCIPDRTMSEMNAAFDSSKLTRTTRGLSDGMVHEDENLLSVGQVGEFAASNMKFNDEG